jgi:hypothetical protein
MFAVAPGRLFARVWLVRCSLWLATIRTDVRAASAKFARTRNVAAQFRITADEKVLSRHRRHLSRSKPANILVIDCF